MEQDKSESQGFRQAFIVTGEASEAAEPAKTALDDPTLREQDEATFGIGQFDDFKLNAKLSSVLHGLVAGVPLVDKGNLNVFTSHFLNLTGQLLNLLAVLLIGGGDAQHQQIG